MSDFHVTSRPLPDGGTALCLSGKLTLATLRENHQPLAEMLRSSASGASASGASASGASAEVRSLDVSGLTALDGAGSAQLLAWRARLSQQAGRAIDIAGASPDTDRLLELYGCPSQHQCLKGEPRREHLLEQIGRTTMDLRGGFKDLLHDLGALCVSVSRAIRAPGSVNWRAVPQLMERAGADGLPIVALINFLIGFIIALQAADQLHRFGADVFLADLIGLSLTRELSALMTAIILAGRTGAAYAAELGTMRVNEEIDALRSMGIDPIRHLVLPRIVAMTVVTPLLTMLAMLVGLLGGLLVALSALDVTPLMFVGQLQRALFPLDIIEGLSKSAVFAMLITFISCQRGLNTRGGAAGVGTSTTSAVVTILFHLIVADAVMSAGFKLVRAL